MTLRWLTAGYGYETTGRDVREAFQFTMEAARNAGCEGEARERVRVLVTKEASPRRMVSTVFGSDLAVPGR